MFLGLTPEGIPVLSPDSIQRIMGANQFVCRDPDLMRRIPKINERESKYEKRQSAIKENSLSM